MIKIGEYQISALVSERIGLDGGAMFGAVPKALWAKKIPADSDNRISLGCRMLVVRNGEREILIDVGMGRKWTEKELKIYNIEYLCDEPVEKILPKATDVIITHLHFDHAGGITNLDENGELVLSFPQANIFVSKRNFDHACSPGVREKASYLESHVLPLETAPGFHLTTDGEEIIPGVRVFQVSGHTEGLQWVQIGQGRGSLVFPSDLIPTAHHLPVHYVMGYDLHAAQTMKEKEIFLSQAVDEEWIVVFEHDLETAAATVCRDKRGRFAVKEKLELSSLI